MTRSGAAAPADARDRPATGARVSGYTLLAPLGAGSTGVVYAACDARMKAFALKIVRAAGMPAARGRARLASVLREARALDRVRHPNVVRIHDVGRDGDDVWLALELVRGRTLRAWSRGLAPGFGAIADALRQAGTGLAAAHAAGIVHADIKPDNVVVGDDGRVRVLDFGLATGEGLPCAAAAPARLGTPAYMAPEQFAGAPASAATDQFAFCVTYWEIAVGARPFRGDSAVAIALQAARGRLRRPPNACKVPRSVLAVLERGLRARPEERWPSMHALLRELANCGAHRRVRSAGPFRP